MRKKPMLAYPASVKPIDYNEPVFIQPKLDGVRCVIQFEKGFNPNIDPSYDDRDKVVAYSRTGKEWKNIDHILGILVPFFMKYPQVILDGELYNHDLKNDFEKIISLVRKTKPTEEDRLESQEMVQFHCYDIIDETKTFEERNEFLQGNFPNTQYIRDVETLQTDEANVHFIHTQNLERGYEGSIVRLNTPYQCKRSHSLRNIKYFYYAEAYIVGYEEGKGKRVGTLGKFVMQDEDGNQFGCPPGKGYNYEDMRDMLKDIHKYMGQTATFTYFERTKAGSYRHPLFKCIRDYE